MSIYQLDFNGNTKLDIAIKRLQNFEPKSEGYYLAFSGGKDSCVIKAIADMAQVKYDAHYSVTSVDPPELVRFIKNFHPDVIWDRNYDKDGKPITMWNLIPTHIMPPTRLVRYCCKALKEGGGEGRFIVTGVRKAESYKRSLRGGIEVANTKSEKRELLDPDNPDQEMIHICQTKAQRILNPIIDWDDSEVWEFLKDFNIPYCELYDQGYKRLGCIGCPMSTKQEEELERYPKYKKAYLKAFEKMLNSEKFDKEKASWKTAEDVMEWWVKE